MLFDLLPAPIVPLKETLTALFVGAASPRDRSFVGPPQLHSRKKGSKAPIVLFISFEGTTRILLPAWRNVNLRLTGRSGEGSFDYVSLRFAQRNFAQDDKA
jgi:hypothetical protein